MQNWIIEEAGDKSALKAIDEAMLLVVEKLQENNRLMREYPFDYRILQKERNDLKSLFSRHMRERQLISSTNIKQRGINEISSIKQTIRRTNCRH